MIGVDSVVVVTDSSVGMDVGMFVAGGNSGSMGVFVIVGEGSVVVVTVSVVEGDSVIGGGLGVGVSATIARDVGVANNVAEAEGEGVGVRHVPGVARARYCGHSSSCIFRSRSPPGRLSQIA